MSRQGGIGEGIETNREWERVKKRFCFGLETVSEVWKSGPELGEYVPSCVKPNVRFKSGGGQNLFQNNLVW